MSRPVIAVTMGDPAGIGPEICLRAVADDRVRKACRPVIVGSAGVLAVAARRIGLAMPESGVRGQGSEGGGHAGVIDLANIRADEIEPGTVRAAHGRAAYEYVRYAIERTLAGEFDAMTTGPISKEALHAAGIEFPGHTEILESATGSPGAVMMLYSPRVTVSLVTTHVALRDVPKAVTAERVLRTIRLTTEAMARLLGRRPRIAVLGLNCHAGEGGLFGDEESRVIAPAVETARAEGLQVAGPLPPDTAFTPRALGMYDAHVCMYHDQGLGPFKALGFEDGVNVTLGIPIVRTSVDHGTAFDIAWQGKAEHGSMVAAILLAARMAARVSV